MPKTKKCPQCKSTYPATREFFMLKSPPVLRGDPLRNTCKKCRLENLRRWELEHPDKARSGRKRWAKNHPESKLAQQRRRSAKWAQEHPEQHLYRGVRRRAREQGLPFNLEPSDIVIPATCPYLGIPLEVRKGLGVGKYPPNIPTVDRIESSGGYIKGNIEVISHRANRLKSDGTAEEHSLIAARMRLLLKSS